MSYIAKNLHLLFLLFLPLVAHAQRIIPEHEGVWVHDEAGVLSQETRRQLELVLQHHRDSTSNQIALYIIPSLNGEEIDDYAVRVFQTWKLGQKGKDNGVLLVIAIEERKARIEVGYGLEGVLTDLMSSRIIRNEISPYFKRLDYDNGVKAGVTAIIQVIKGEYVNERPEPPRRSKQRSPLFTILFILFLIVYLSRRRGGRGGGYRSGGGWILPMGGFGSSGNFGGGSWGGGGRSGGGGASGSW